MTCSLKLVTWPWLFLLVFEQILSEIISENQENRRSKLSVEVAQTLLPLGKLGSARRLRFKNLQVKLTIRSYS